jgi:hypothetical protein
VYWDHDFMSGGWEGLLFGDKRHEGAQESREKRKEGRKEGEEGEGGRGKRGEADGGLLGRGDFIVMATRTNVWLGVGSVYICICTHCR